MSNINLEAYNKLSTAFAYAQQIKGSADARGADSVVRLQGGDALSCSYSNADAPRGLFNIAARNQDQKALNDATRAVFRQAVIDIFGTSIDDVPKKVRSAMCLSDYGHGKPLTARRILAVNKAVDAELKAFAKQFGITGGAAGQIASIVAKDSGLSNVANPRETFQDRVNRHGKASTTTLIADQMAGNKHFHSFSVDFARGMGISLGGKKVKTRDPAAARDKIVQFLTGNRRATFADADPATQRKAGVLMSVMHQGSFGIAMGAVGTGFDPQDKDTKFMATEGTAMGGAQTNGFSVTKDGAGNITIKGTAKFLRHATLMANNDKQQLTGATDDDGSYVQYNIEIRIPAGDMEKFAEADWSKCSTAEATRIEQNNHLEDRFQKAADTIEDGYKFTGSVNVSLKAKINAIYDLPTMYDRINNRNNH